MSQSPLVLVSGASGFMAGHIINILLREGYRVRGTVRSLKNTEKVKPLREICPERNQNLELVEADLLDNNCWAPLVKNCDYVIHTASPFPANVPEDPNDVIIPAVNGTEAIMKASIQNNIKKLVLTSSIASVSTGAKKNFFTNEDWSNPDLSPPYERSKHLAEKKAWEIYEQNKKLNPNNYMKLTTIMPSLMQGPSFTPGIYTSGTVVQRLMKNEFPGLAKLSFSHVDVREVAQAHVNALNKDVSDGKRYLLTEGSYWLEDTANVLRDEFEKYGYKIPSSTIGRTLFSIAACFDKSLQVTKPYLDRMIVYDNQQTRKELDIFFRPNRETLLETAYDQIKKGLIPDLINKKQ